MKRGKLTIITIILALCLASCASDPYDPNEDINPGDGGTGELVLVWQDEFDGPVDQSPDPTKWGYDVGNGDGGWGNQQLEFDTARPENVSLDGAGNLRIIAREEDYNGFSYTSARIKTQGKFSRAYGRFEARIQLPVGRGIWPAFWLLGDNIGTVGWPQCGEIDIMEYRGQLPSVANGALHGPGYSGGSPLTGSYTLTGAGFNEGFHVFAVEWTSNAISWSVDGTTYLTVGPGDLPGGAAWVFDHPFFIILNVAVGGNYVGDPDQTTVFPQTMLIDYVRVYGAQ
ncbi:MAG: glycoside hydrolase family 16 protein [Candidatus Krumholzibacteriia bacterium]